jgi:hypothetical protein
MSIWNSNNVCSAPPFPMKGLNSTQVHRSTYKEINNSLHFIHDSFTVTATGASIAP